MTDNLAQLVFGGSDFFHQSSFLQKAR